MTRDPVTIEAIKEALKLAAARADRKMMGNKGALVNTHEAFGKIYEEVQEAAQEMHDNNTEAFKDELIDIIVACAWGIASL
jgi:NTP pyrophosphatase (non-canonical NTP hydrolase)